MSRLKPTHSAFPFAPQAEQGGHLYREPGSGGGCIGPSRLFVSKLIGLAG